MNPVNCVGVSGAGLARQFKRRFTSAQEYYEDGCLYGSVRPGQPFIYRHRDSIKQILFFPTKDHWRDPSRIEWVDSGLTFIAERWNYMGITSLAIPKIGAGLGGLDWAEVHEHIVVRLRDLPIEIEVVL